MGTIALLLVLLLIAGGLYAAFVAFVWAAVSGRL